MSIGQILPGYSAAAPYTGAAGTGGTAGTGGIPGLGTAQANPLAALTGGGGLGGGDIMGQFMQLLMMMMQLLITMLGSKAKAADMGGGPSGFLNQGGGSGGAGNAGGAGGAGSGQVTQLASRGITADGSARISNVDGNAGEKDALDNSLAAIAKDPEGAALLKAAQAKGVTIEVGDPGQAFGSADAVNCNCGQHGGTAAADAGGNVLGVTLNQGGKTHIIVRDPSNIKTIVHELVHAVSTGDGNSKHEEGIADVVGYRVASRVTGQQTQSEGTIYNNKIGVAGYAGLSRYNGIEQTLAQLGISAFA